VNLLCKKGYSFLVFPKSCEFAGFLVENFKYLRTWLMDFCFEASVGNPIKFYYESLSKKTWPWKKMIVKNGPEVELG
jgi:hypothetical protein